MKIIDFHAHAFPRKVATKAIDRLEIHYNIEIENVGTLEHLVTTASQADIHRSVLHASATNARQVEAVNNWIADVTSPRIIRFGTIHPEYEDIEKELIRLKSLGIKGLKLHPDFQQFDLTDQKMYELYEKIGDQFLVLFHVGDDVYPTEDNYSTPQKMAQVIKDFPQLNAVAGHLGGYRMWDEAEKNIIGHDIYLDTSSVFRYISLERASELIKAHGTDKVLFGSDYPMEVPAKEIKNVLNLDLSLTDKWKILYKNGFELLSRFDLL
ncbi:MAG: amidohydrolase 2 [Candidatus Frackibacter sp. T328-2]|nr:MAG: amidohydrolase 2 [Candidatus Frackibacter sp. T328-2]